MTDEQQPVEMPASHGDPGMPSAGRRPAADGPTAHLTPSTSQPNAEPADAEPTDDAADEDEPTVVTPVVPAGEEATVRLASVPGAAGDQQPEPRIADDGETVRLQRSFFAPGTDGPVQAAPAPEPGQSGGSPASWSAGESAGPEGLGESPAPGAVDHGEAGESAKPDGVGDSLISWSAGESAGPETREAAEPEGVEVGDSLMSWPAHGSVDPADEGEGLTSWSAGEDGAPEPDREGVSPEDEPGRAREASRSAGAEPESEQSSTPLRPEPVDAASPELVIAPAGEPSEDADRVPEKAASRRISSAGALIWVLLALLGFTLVVQLRSNDADAGLATARQEDLVGILSDLEARDQRLQQEINGLEESQRQLTSGVAGRQAALAEADKRADELGLLAGTLPARGPGLKISIDAKGQPIKASAILNAVQELRGAGGEVMEIIGNNGVAVRIVASSSFVDAAGGEVVVDGKQLSGPYTLLVIGVPATMQTALQIPGGVVASVSQAGGNVTMEQRSTVEVTAVRQPTSLQYARPVS